MKGFTFAIDTGAWWNLKVRVRAVCAVDAFQLVNHHYGKNNIKMVRSY